MRLREGITYRTRRGTEITVKPNPDDPGDHYPWISSDDMSYTDSGSYYRDGREDCDDIVEIVATLKPGYVVRSETLGGTEYYHVVVGKRAITFSNRHNTHILVESIRPDVEGEWAATHIWAPTEDSTTWPSLEHDNGWELIYKPKEADKVEITVKVNGEEVSPLKISEETWAALRK